MYEYINTGSTMEIVEMNNIIRMNEMLIILNALTKC